MKIERFNNHKVNETKDSIQEIDTVIENKYEAGFYGNEGLYKLIWYPDLDGFKIIFPTGKYLWNRITSINNDLNPYTEYEDGALLNWMRHILFSKEYDEQPFSNQYKIKLTESSDEDLHLAIFMDNTISTEFIGLEGGTYVLTWNLDDNSFSVLFPDSKIHYSRVDLLLRTDLPNPLETYENGMLISYIRHMIYGEDYNRTSIVNDYKVESLTEISDKPMIVYLYNNDDYDAAIIRIGISDNLIDLRIPERLILSSPDKLYDKMPELKMLYNGELLDFLKDKYLAVTGKVFGS